jgi:glycosyltransferase involved in cell wall biosynthesis
MVDIFYRIFLKKSDAILSYCQLSTDYLINKYNISKNIIFTGTQYINNNTIENPKPIKQNRINIVYLGRLLNLKGVQDVIKALKNIKDEDSKNLIFHIVGDGEYMVKLKKLSKNMKNIIFHGWLEGDKKENILKKCDILILPSYYDSWGFVITEGMAKGLAIITTNDIGAKELVKYNGYIYNAGNVEELRKILNELLKNPEKIDKMKKNSILIIKNNTLNKSIETFLNAINLVK